MKRNRSAGIVIKDNKLLVMRRINSGNEYWEFPGGGQENEETLEQTAIREIYEETTLRVKTERLIYHIIWDTGEENFFYLCKYISGEPQLRPGSKEFELTQAGGQIYEPMWINIEKLPTLRLYQFEIRDLFLNDYKNGFPEHVQKLSIKFAERRHI